MTSQSVTVYTFCSCTHKFEKHLISKTAYICSQSHLGQMCKIYWNLLQADYNGDFFTSFPSPFFLTISTFYFETLQTSRKVGKNCTFNTLIPSLRFLSTLLPFIFLHIHIHSHNTLFCLRVSYRHHDILPLNASAFFSEQQHSPTLSQLHYNTQKI